MFTVVNRGKGKAKHYVVCGSNDRIEFHLSNNLAQANLLCATLNLVSRKHFKIETNVLESKVNIYTK